MEIKDDLALFGLNEQEMQVYLLLLRHGWSTVVQLSKICPIKRTTIYRTLNELSQKGLVVLQLNNKTTLYDASPPSSFESLILESQKKTAQLKESFNHIEQYFSKFPVGQTTETKVQYYRGLRGLKQMDWSMVARPNVEIQALDSDKWAKVLGADFAEEKREEAVKKGIRYRCIQNSEDRILDDGTTTWTANKEYTKRHYRHRLIPKKVLNIKQDIYILPESIYFRGVRDNDVVAVRIINADYAAMMKQMFEPLWAKACIIDNFGRGF